MGGGAGRERERERERERGRERENRGAVFSLHSMLLKSSTLSDFSVFFDDSETLQNKYNWRSVCVCLPKDTQRFLLFVADSFAVYITPFQSSLRPAECISWLLLLQ